jgi:uroporphyrin-3 C-methyltransferase
MFAGKHSMDPTPPISSDIAQAVEPGMDAARMSPPATPFAKPVSRGVVFFVAFVLAGVVGLAWFDARNSADALRSEVTRRLTDEDAALSQAKVRDTDQSGDLREAHAKLALLETRMVELQAQQASLESLYHDIAPSRDDILLTEVEQILLLASQQLSLAANVPAALAALQLADGRLAGTNRAQLTLLRRALARDMDRLKAVPAVDVSGIAVKLNRVLDSIDTLPLAQDERLPEPPPAKQPKDDSAWLAFLRSTWDELKSVVRIEVSDRAVAPLVPPAQQYFLRENLRLRLLSARVALLSRDESSFKSDIAAANAWVKTYFDLRANSVQALMATLTQIGATAMPAELPDINESFTALRTLKASRERSSVRAATVPGSPSRAP